MGLFSNVPAPRVLLREITKLYLLAFAVLTVSILALSARRLLNESEYSSVQLFKLVALSVPFIAAMTVPMAVFIAVLMVLLRVAKTPSNASEPTARSAFSALIVPILLFSGGAGAATFGLTSELVPRTNALYADIRLGKPALHGDRTMTLGQLQSRQVDLDREARRSEGQQARVIAVSNQVEIHKKYSLAIACIALALVAVAIAMLRPTGGTRLIVGSSLIVYGGYYMGLMGGEAMADALVISPFLAMWGVNLTLLAATLPMFWIRRQQLLARQQE